MRGKDKHCCSSRFSAGESKAGDNDLFRLQNNSVAEHSKCSDVISSRAKNVYIAVEVAEEWATLYSRPLF